MKSLLLIFLGGGTGSVLRYLLTISIYRQGTTNFPWGTFAVNILGCILIGVFYTLTSRIHINNDIRLMLTIGLCGGFTTFSTFSNESLQLLKSGLYPSFFTYIIGSVVLGILGVMLGIWMSEIKQKISLRLYTT